MQHVCISSYLPRSGTTLLELLLGAHQDILIMPENHIFRLAFSTKNSTLSLALKKRLTKLALSEQKLGTWPGTNPQDIVPLIEQANTAGELFSLVGDYYANVKKKDPKVMGHKRDFYAGPRSFHVKQHLPDTVFVFLVRDPRDAIRSCIKNISTYTLKKALSEILIRHVWIRKLQRRYPQDVLVISYESLVTHPAKTLQLITDRLGVVYHEQMLTYYQSNSSGEQLIGATKSIHSRTARAIDTSAIGRYKRYDVLSKVQVRFIELMLSSFFSEYAYLPTVSNNKHIRVKHVKDFVTTWCYVLARIAKGYIDRYR